MVFNLTHSQIILRYKENGGRIEPYTIVIMPAVVFSFLISHRAEIFFGASWARGKGVFCFLGGFFFAKKSTFDPGNGL
jgi:hypothetical protein